MTEPVAVAVRSVMNPTRNLSSSAPLPSIDAFSLHRSDSAVDVSDQQENCGVSDDMPEDGQVPIAKRLEVAKALTTSNNAVVVQADAGTALSAEETVVDRSAAADTAVGLGLFLVYHKATNSVSIRL